MRSNEFLNLVENFRLLKYPNLKTKYFQHLMVFISGRLSRFLEGICLVIRLSTKCSGTIPSNLEMQKLRLKYSKKLG